MTILHANTDPDLLTRLRQMLSSAARADIAVGYFFMSGFSQVADDLARLNKNPHSGGTRWTSPRWKQWPQAFTRRTPFVPNWNWTKPYPEASGMRSPTKPRLALPRA